MRLAALEKLPHWQATVEYHGSQGEQIICLLQRGLLGELHWIIADYQGDWPWQAVREYDPIATARMVELGKMRLVKGQWPDTVADMLAQSRTPLVLFPPSERPSTTA
jgi:hypothetical protein